VTLETVIEKKKFYLDSLPCNSSNFWHKLVIVSMCAEPQAEPKLSFSSVPKHLLVASHSEEIFSFCACRLGFVK
jgi:hypothetical protein